MSEMLKEIGKGFITFGNISSALVFLRLFLEGGSFLILVFGITTFISFYTVGSLLIKKGENYGR